MIPTGRDFGLAEWINFDPTYIRIDRGEKIIYLNSKP